MSSARAVTIAGALSVLALTLAARAARAAPVANDCDRSCLNGVAEQYLAAMPSHDPSRAPLAKGVRYTENGVELTLPDGLWRTLESIGAYRLSVTDPRQQTVAFFAKAQENGAPLLLATRLRTVARRITEIESLAVRLTGTIGTGPSGLPHEDMLGDSPRKQFVTSLAPQERRPRAELMDIVNRYFTGIENNTGDKPPPFSSDCLRLENGAQTTGRPIAPGANPAGFNFGCKEAFALGYFREDTRLHDRRVLAVDEERGLVYAAACFDHDAVLRSYPLKDGRSVTVRNTAPWTWQIHEIFQINGAGEIGQIEAVLLSVPYGMRSGWSTGAHFPSPQAVRDRFREY